MFFDLCVESVITLWVGDFRCAGEKSVSPEFVQKKGKMWNNIMIMRNKQGHGL